MFLASVLGLKNECFCSNSEAVSPSPGLQPPPLMLSPPPQNNTDPLDMETHSHPRTHNSHTCIHTKCSYTPTHTQITYSHTQAYTHSHVVIHSNHIYIIPLSWLFLQLGTILLNTGYGVDFTTAHRSDFMCVCVCVCVCVCPSWLSFLLPS